VVKLLVSGRLALIPSRKDQKSDWTDATLRRYLFGMFRRCTDWVKQYWLTAKAGGRSRFIWRDKVLGSFFVWLTVMAALAVFVDRNPLSASNICIDLAILPLCLLSGYLSSVWRWKELDKKYPESSS
jgi:hypothetical protein